MRHFCHFCHTIETIGRIECLYYTSGHNYCNSIIIEGLRIISVYRRAVRGTALRLASTLRLSHTIVSAIRCWSLSIDVQFWLGFDNRPVLSTVKLRATCCRRSFSLLRIHSFKLARTWSVYWENGRSYILKCR